jgi:glycosyltransferase involved in cell wall biosynthesis
MKVLVVNNMAPFIWGGAEELAAHLQKNLVASGHEAEVLRIPFRWDPPGQIPAQMLMARAFELFNVDHVIALKFPAYLVRHPHKTLWLLHQYRQAYDLFDSGDSNLTNSPAHDAIRGVIKQADDACFQESRRIFTNSETTRRRLAHYNGVEAEVLPPPLNDPELFTGGASEGYVFAGGRINAMKRQHVLVEAMAYAPKHVRLVVAGPPDTPDDAARLRRLVERLGLQDRVKLDLRFLSRQELATYVNQALACAYLPYDEDSLGYVTMEAAAAGKALITTRDSGGVLGLVSHGETGWVAEPQARAIADALAQAAASPAATRERGAAARHRWTQLDLTWAKTIARLLP